jgi:hypothetical protein
MDAYGSAELSFTFTVTEEVASIAIIFRILRHEVWRELKHRKDVAELVVNTGTTGSSTLVKWRLCT